MAPEPAPASTVVLVRDGRLGIEAYLLRRVTSMAFAPSMHVSTGGRVDARDYNVPVTFAGPGAGGRADWIRAVTAVERFEARDMAMLPPTITIQEDGSFDWLGDPE